MAKDKTLTLEEIEKAFSNLRTYSYSPSVNADKIIELCGLDNLEKYKSIIGQKLQRFQNGDSDDINPIEILGEQPKGGIFGLKRKKIDRENWERFYTQEGRQQIIDLVMKNAGESYDKYQEAAKACADEQGDLKRLQLYSPLSTPHLMP